jgi:hypothetical protein
MDACHPARCQRRAVAATAVHQVPVQVVDVGGREFADRQVAKMRFEVMLDDAEVLASRARRPLRRRGGHPPVKQVVDGAGAHFAVLGLASELGELRVGIALGAPHSRRRPPLLAGVGVDTQVHTELPAIGASFTE